MEQELGALHTLLFGREPVENDVKRWHTQGFRFSDRKGIEWGLTQLYGGPCGILATVQAFIVKDLIYGRKVELYQGNDATRSPFENIGVRETTTALIKSLVRIIDQATPGTGDDEKETSKSNTKKNYVFVSKDDDNKYVKTSVRGKAALLKLVAKNMHLLSTDCGVLLFVFSVILSRGIDTIKSDMDDLTQPLVARFGHCSQELVNLMLCGHAVTNVFDGNKVLGDDPHDPTAFALHGIPSKNNIGYLTLLESMHYCKVGANLKSPVFPIWVVGSSSHYTVMFALDERVGKVSKSQQKLTVLRASFNELDPHENGFVPTTQVHALLSKVGVQTSMSNAELERLVDPDKMGIITWQNFQTALGKLRNAPQGWSCGMCTYNNAPNRQTCEMCTTAKPQPSSTHAVVKKDDEESKEDDVEEPQQFSLFHFNGLDGHGNSVACCTRVSVTLLEDVLPRGDVQKRGLREVILTRWPNALVEYGAKEPKIS